jgi:DNA-binding protein YbaB
VTQKSDRDVNRDLQERFAQVHGEYTRLRAGMGEMQQRLTRLRVSESSPDGFVTAVVGPRGHLVGLELDPRVYRDQDPVALASTITETVRRATARAADETSALLAEYVPANTAAMGLIRGNDFGTLLSRYDEQLAGDDDDDRGGPGAR